MKKVLITGSSGFIGKNMVEHFEKKGYDVYTADIKIGEDLRDLEVCMLATYEMDWVIHLAADNGGYFYLKDKSDQVAKNNLLIDSNLFIACRHNKVKRIFFASSSCVYPLPNGENEYGQAKFASEILLDLFNIPCSIARFQNVYGEHETIGGEKEKVMPSLIRQINSGKVNVYGDGSQMRSFIYVKDVCKEIEEMMKKKKKMVDLGGHIVSIKELLNYFIAISGKKVKVKFGKFVKDRDNKFPKNSSKTDLITGLRRTFKWTTKNLK